MKTFFSLKVFILLAALFMGGLGLSGCGGGKQSCEADFDCDGEQDACVNGQCQNAAQGGGQQGGADAGGGVDDTVD